MSIAIAVAAGLASAVAYGLGTAGQHSAAYCGDVDAKGLAKLLRNPRWLVAGVGDVLGVLLQIVALSNGPVVLVQPILVLSLPVAVLAGAWFGLAKPRQQDLINCGLLVLGLAIFFLLIGTPKRGHIISDQAAGWTSVAVLLVGLAAIGATRHSSPVPRAVVIGAVAGCWFGVVSVLVEAVSGVWETAGANGLVHPHGLVPILGLLVLGLGGFLLVQIGFQLGPLGASLPANLVLDPLVAVVLGSTLLHEHLPLGGLRWLGYLLALALISRAAIALAQPSAVPVGTFEPAGRSRP